MTTKYLITVKREDLEKALSQTGLLYALNFLVLHPAGLALGLDYDETEVPPRLELLSSGDEVDPIIFASEVFELGREKLKAFLDRRNKLGMSLHNESLLNQAINITADAETFSSHYESSEFRHLLGTEVRPPLLVRDLSKPYVTYMPYERKDMILSMAGAGRKDPARIVSLLERAWVIDHPKGAWLQHADPPSTISLPLWLCSVWDTLVEDLPADVLVRSFAGKRFVGNQEDRIFLTHGPS